MSKMSMEEYGKLLAGILSVPRRQRDMIEKALAGKREAEDIAKITQDAAAAVKATQSVTP